MARQTKCRRICCLPKSTLFQPDGQDSPRLVLNLDEVEALRLADLEGLDQDTAAARMEVFHRLPSGPRPCLNRSRVDSRTPSARAMLRPFLSSSE